MKFAKGGTNMIGRGILFGLGALIFAAAAALFFGWILMLLWNWLMPEIFGLGTIGYFQAWGLILLSHLLFKGIGHGRHSDFYRRRKSGGDRFFPGPGTHPDREDREAFKKEFRDRMRRHWDNEGCEGESPCGGDDPES
jgi:hypothetical protein